MVKGEKKVFREKENGGRSSDNKARYYIVSQLEEGAQTPKYSIP